MAYWDYSRNHGEQTWNKNWKCGTHQSPINIITEKTVRKDGLDDLKFNGGKVKLALLNKGFNISISPLVSNDKSHNNSDECQLFVNGGPAESEYYLKEFHFHWGNKSLKGSEHEIDGNKFDAELHMVHYKRNQHKSFDDALNDECGLCVIGIFLERKDDVSTNPVLKEILDMTKHIPYKNDTYIGTKEIDLYDITKEISKEYFTYGGSLTTPPLSECVRWIVLKKPLYVSSSDLENLYNINADTMGKEKYHDPCQRDGDCACAGMPKIRNNFRSCCSINDRIVSHVL